MHELFKVNKLNLYLLKNTIFCTRLLVWDFFCVFGILHDGDFQRGNISRGDFWHGGFVWACMSVWILLRAFFA